MPKVKTSFTLSPEALDMLLKISKVVRRSKADTIEQLIFEEAKRLKIK